MGGRLTASYIETGRGGETPLPPSIKDLPAVSRLRENHYPPLLTRPHEESVHASELQTQYPDNVSLRFRGEEIERLDDEIHLRRERVSVLRCYRKGDHVGGIAIDDGDLYQLYMGWTHVARKSI